MITGVGPAAISVEPDSSDPRDRSLDYGPTHVRRAIVDENVLDPGVFLRQYRVDRLANE
jgi:hypothetical protein